MNNLQVNALVIGSGIAGMQAALDLGDQGFQVALVEREASIGGKMITLSKVFPTLDCCSCITTPKCRRWRIIQISNFSPIAKCKS